MAKWGLWTAHRYIWAGAAVRRQVGADGRSLQRPWRVRSEEAIAEATRIRARRPQGVWSRVLGWGCIGIALVAALQPMSWAQPHLEVSAHGVPAPEAPGRSIAISAPKYDPVEAGFHWSAGDQDGLVSLVVLGDEYREVARFDGIEGSAFFPDQGGAGPLRTGQTYAAYLVGSCDGSVTKSPLVSFVWR